MSTQRKILITSALPYANGPIHLGHLVEYIQTDIWARFQKMRGNECYYVCADDAHGTPIMLRARQDGITPEQLIEAVSKDHQADFADFLIDFDNYHSTHSEENKELSQGIYRTLRDAGHMILKRICFYRIVLLRVPAQNVALKISTEITVRCVVQPTTQPI